MASRVALRHPADDERLRRRQSDHGAHRCGAHVTGVARVVTWLVISVLVLVLAATLVLEGIA
jgi:hypothetical protein